MDFVATDLDFVAPGLDFVVPGFDFLVPDLVLLRLTWRTARSRRRAERFRQMAIGRSISYRLAASFCERYRGHELRSSYPNHPEVCFLKS